MLFNMGHTHKYFSPVFLFLVCSMCIIMPVNAQRDKQIWKEAEKSLSVYDYGNALKNYDVLYDKYPDNANYAFKIGYCYLYGSELNDVDQAIEYLKKAQKNITEKYNDNFRETKSPPETEYFLGVAYRLQSDYEKAIEHFKAYKSYKKKNMESLTDELIDREISSCEFSLNNPPEEFQVKKYSFDIDIPEGQYLRCPVISGNDSVFVYTIGNQNVYPPDININRSLYHIPVDDIYYSVWENDSWSDPENISDDLGGSGFAMPTSLSYDGTSLLLVQDDNNDGNIYMSEFKNGKWQTATKLNKNINSSRWESHAVMNKDETKLYFTSARKGGQGGLDLYVSERDDRTKDWSVPQGLSDIINTDMHEETPFLLEQQNQLYFGSEKHGNMGGFDMFVSVYDSVNNQWGYPINLGYPYNTVGNDLAYIVSFRDLFIYCPQNSNKRRDGISGSDCFSLKMPPRERLFTLKGQIYIPDLDNQIPVDLKIAVIDNETDDTLSIHKPEADGSFVIKDLPANDVTILAMSSEKTQNQIIEVNIPETQDRIEYPIELHLNVSDLALKEDDDEDTKELVKRHKVIEVEEVIIKQEITDLVEKEQKELALNNEAYPDSTRNRPPYTSNEGDFKGQYLIIGGSFMYPENARKAVSIYEKMGYTCHILITDGGFNRVVIKTLDNVEDAREQLKKLRQETSVDDLWILRQ
jgi:hypothetical protein